MQTALKKLYDKLNQFHGRTYSTWRILCIFIPIFSSNVLTMSISIVDSMMVSVINEGAVSGLTLAGDLYRVFLYFITGLVLGSTIIATQYVGQENAKKAVAVIKQSILISYAVALPFSLCFLLFAPQLIQLFFGAIEDPQILEAAVIGTRFYGISLLLQPLQFCITQVFTCQGKTKITLVMNVIANLVNVLGNYLTIHVFHWGVPGAMWATLFSCAVCVVGLWIFACKKENPLRLTWGSFRSFIPEKETIKKVLSLGIPSGFENNLSTFAKILVAALVVRCGTMSINANAVAHKLTSMFVMGGNAAGSTMSIVVGHCQGAQKPHEVKYYTKYFLFASMLMQALFAAGLILFMDPLVAGYNVSRQTAQLIKDLTIPYLLLGIPFWTMAYTPPHAMRACGDVKFPMFLSVGSLWLCRVALAYLFYTFIHPGIWSIWAASYADWLVRGGLNLIHLKGGRWMRKKVV